MHSIVFFAICKKEKKKPFQTNCIHCKVNLMNILDSFSMPSVHMETPDCVTVLQCMGLYSLKVITVCFHLQISD